MKPADPTACVQQWQAMTMTAAAWQWLAILFQLLQQYSINSLQPVCDDGSNILCLYVNMCGIVWHVAIGNDSLLQQPCCVTLCVA